MVAPSGGNDYSGWFGALIAAAAFGASIVGGIGKVLMRQLETALKLHATKEVNAAEARMEQHVEASMRSIGETVLGIRQHTGTIDSALHSRISEVELESERKFMPRTEFNEFRREYREDVRQQNDKLDRILRRNSHDTADE